MSSHTSASALSDYLNCPALYYMKHVLKLKGLVSYPMLCGKGVHDFVASLYRQRPKERKFFYKSLDSALGAWHFKWSRLLAENESSIMDPSKATAGKYRNVGVTCISNYWKSNESRPDPIKFEDRKRITIFGGMELVTVTDQTRAVSEEVIKKYRPDLMQNGELDSNYLPEVIIDFKTSVSDWDRKDQPSELAKAGDQYHLANSIQAIAYTRSYKAFSGKWPIGFFFYALYHNKFYFINSEDDVSQSRLDETVLHLVQNLDNESFPKHPTPNCKYCSHLQQCLKEDGFRISVNTDSPTGPDIRQIFKKERRSEYAKQLRMKFPR